MARARLSRKVKRTAPYIRMDSEKIKKKRKVEIKKTTVLKSINGNVAGGDGIKKINAVGGPKLFPVFKKKEKSDKSVSFNLSTEPIVKKVKRARVPLVKPDQYAIDAGQKDFDGTQCKTCGMIYTVGEYSDEAHHASYHDNFVSSLKFNGWKNERVLKYYDDRSRIIAVLPQDQKFMLKKVDELFTIADLELGIRVSINECLKPTSMFLIYVTNKRIAGFVAAQGITLASRLIPDMEYCVETKTEPAVVGVTRLWIHPNYRRRGVATKLLDILRANFLKTDIIPRGGLAFTDPTQSGRIFAQEYTGTRAFLIFQYV